MDVRLSGSLFQGGEAVITYGNKQATFIIVNESFEGNDVENDLNRITVVVRSFDEEGELTGTAYCSPIIGVGDMIVGVIADDAYAASINGTPLNKDNMIHCQVRLYE